jgi:hypothetical protein
MWHTASGHSACALALMPWGLELPLLLLLPAGRVRLLLCVSLGRAGVASALPPTGTRQQMHSLRTFST